MAIVQFLPPGVAASSKEVSSKFRRRLNRLTSGTIGDTGNIAKSVQELTGKKEGLSFLGGLKTLRRLVKGARQLAATNLTQEAVQALVLNSAIVEMADFAKEQEFESIDEAIAVRDEISGLLEEAAITSRDDDTFLEFMDLRSAVVQDLTARSADLSRIETKIPEGSTNALLMAYDLYGDAERHNEVADRNGLAAPGFITRNTPLRVLNE